MTMLLALSVPSPKAQAASYHSFHAAQTVPDVVRNTSWFSEAQYNFNSWVYTITAEGRNYHIISFIH